MEPTVHGIPGTLVDSAIRKETADLRSIVRITQLQCADQLGSISVDNRKIVVSLADKYSFTFHTSQGYEPTTSPWKLACDVLMAVAVAVHTAGHFPIAARLFGRYADKSSLTSNSVVLARMAHCMAHAGHVIQGLQIAEALSENRETYVEALLLMCALRRQQAAFSDTECQHLQRFLENQVRIAEKSGDRGRLATAHYNLGRHLCMSQVLSAFRHYKKAARLDPDYVDRHYFCAEIGGMLFDTGHYVISAKWYERALNLGAEANCRALYADALLFAGKYRESEENFKAYLESTADLAAEWRLKAFVVGGIRRMLNVEGQTRQRQHALKIVGSISHLEGTEKQRALEDALRLDALCQLAWFNLGVLSNEEKDQEDALLCFLVAALLRKSDIEAWCNACVLWFSTKTPSAFLQACTIEAAYEATGEAFIEQMQRVVDKQSTDFPRLEVMEALNKAVATLPRRPTPFHVRLLGEGSSVEIIRL